MTPEEKAKELVDKFSEYAYTDWHGGENELTNKEASKECALIAADEIIESLEAFGYSGGMYDDFETGRIISLDEKHPTGYWYKVKEKINKINFSIEPKNDL